MTGNGKPIDPRDGIVPVIKRVSSGTLAIIGTGFYITRYGLFMTAHHVLASVVNEQKQVTCPSYVMHRAGENEVHLRKILRFSLLSPADLAVGHADNFKEKFPKAPLMNLRGRLSTEVPFEGSQVVTYAYPENKMLDFTRPENVPTVSSDYYDGQFLRYVSESENPFMPYPHYETTIQIRSGASGGPVFDNKGRIVGVNCRGWDFRGSEFEGENLSSVVPIREALAMEIVDLQLPEPSWEHDQVPREQRGKTVTVMDLVRFGHIEFEPPIFK